VDGESNEVLTANYNMLYRLRHVGGYSPLLLRRYYDLTKDFGFSDASLGRHAFSEEVWRKERSVLDVLGVEMIASNAKSFLSDIETYKSFTAQLFK